MSEERYVSDAPDRVAAWVASRVGCEPAIAELHDDVTHEADTTLLAPIWRLTNVVADRLVACGALSVAKLDLAVFHSVSTSGPLDRLLGAMVDAGLYPRRVVAARREPGADGTVLLVQCRRGRLSDLDALGVLIRTAELSQLLRQPGRPSPRVASDLPAVVAELSELSAGFEVHARWADDEEALRRASPQVVLTNDPGAPSIRAAAEAGAQVMDVGTLGDAPGAVSDPVAVVPAEVPRPAAPVAWMVGSTEDADGLERLQEAAARWPGLVTRLRVHWLGEVPGPSPTVGATGDVPVDLVTAPSSDPWPRPTPDLVIVAPPEGGSDAPDLADMAEDQRAHGLDALVSAVTDDAWWVVRTAAVGETDRARVGADLDLAGTLEANGATVAVWRGAPAT